VRYWSEREGDVTIPFAINFSPQRAQKLAFTVKASVKVGEKFNLIATASSQLPITIAGSNPNIVRINGDGTATALAKGRVTLTATQSGNKNYSAAKPVAKRLTVN
jgi:hypothetical protein